MADAQLNIAKIAAETLTIPIVGTAPLIMHRWSDKAKRQMLEAQQGKKRVKEHRDPVADYESSFYRIFTDEGELYGFPATAFKSAIVSAARFFDKSVTMTALRQSVFTHGVYSKADPQALVQIHGTPQMREDVVRVGQGTDLRYRAEFIDWRADLKVTYIEAMLDRGSLLSLLDGAGMGVGIGEWRPEKSGAFGTFTIDTDRDIQVVQ